MKTQQQQRRDDDLQRMQARGNTQIVPTYRARYDGRGDVVAQTYLGHRATFAKRMTGPLADNVSRVSIGAKVADDTATALIVALRAQQLANVATNAARAVTC